MNALLPFYLGSGKDSSGRSLEDVLALSDESLENAHDYIQWLFPLLERSATVPSSPVLDDSLVRSFRTDGLVRRNMRRSLELMLRFYGLELRSSSGKPQVVRSANFNVRAPVWISRRNHNHHRLTRILECLSIVSASDLGRALLRMLLEIAAESPEAFSHETLEYWKSSVISPE